MAKAKSWREGAAGQPSFPSDFEVKNNAVLQKTDLKANNNKYYSIEMHAAGGQFRVYTHYGRTDDLETNPNAGTRESRFFASEVEAAACYQQIFRQKTSKSKGYQEVSLASSNIGSHKARGQSSGEVDAATLQRIEGEKDKPKAVVKASKLPLPVQEFVANIYEEATSALTSIVQAKITANGIETPLGVLTIGQIDKGQLILDKAYSVFEKSKSAKSRLMDLSGEFYSVIPHRLGRTRRAVEQAAIDTLAEFSIKQETLQLMRDMLSVQGDDAQVLFDPEVDKKYGALGCEIGWLDPKDSRFGEIRDHVEKSQVKTKNIRVKRIYSLRRQEEHARFRGKLKNHQLLFHGSRPKNWVGILSRGILMPKIAVSMGVNRTDAGWLGHGIYFGNAACTTLYYTSPGKRQTRMMGLASVALGKTKKYRKITYGLNAPPAGYDSCHGVRRTKLRPSEFEDDELVIYDAAQQRLDYLVEYTG